MNEEFTSLVVRKSWSPLPRPLNIKPIAYRWIFQLNYNPDGNNERHKGWLIAMGYSQ